jgi:hypothetical protein
MSGFSRNGEVKMATDNHKDVNGIAQYSALDEALGLSGRLKGATCDLIITDTDVLEAIKRYPSLNEAVYSLLKVGACATLATSTGFDVQAVQRELDHAVGEAAEVLKTVQTRLEEALGESGPFADACRKANHEIETLMGDIFTKQGDPETPGSVIAKMQSVTKHIDEMLTAVRKGIGEELTKTTERQAESITKALREMRDLDPSSAIGGAFARMEKGLADLNAVVAANQGANAERQRGTAKGAKYEEQVAAAVAEIAAVYGDRAEQTGTQAGRVLDMKKASLRGDVTVFIEDEPGIVFEAMDREKGKLSKKLVQEELGEAMQNRAAPVAIAVISTTEGTLMCGQPLQVLSRDAWAVHLCKEHPSLLPLQLAYRLARVASQATKSEQPEVDFDKLRAGVEEINRKLVTLNDVRTQLTNIGGAQEKAYASLAQFEREMREGIIRLLTTLEAQRSLQEAA